MKTSEAASGLKPIRRVGIIAGEGRLPFDVADALRRQGGTPFVVMAGEPALTHAGLAEFDHVAINLEQAAELVPLLKRHGVSHAVLSGAIRRRPNWKAFRPSVGLLRLVPSILQAMRGGDDGLLRILIRYIEDGGIKVIGAQEICPDILSPAGVLTTIKPTAQDRRDLRAAFRAAKAIGALDIGQAAVSIGGRVIAMEGVEGTDGLLERVVELRKHGRVAKAKRGVLVKCAKPGQELRADLPTIGVDTIHGAKMAGLAGVGVEAEHSLILERDAVIAAAHREGLFVVGLSEHELDG